MFDLIKHLNENNIDYTVSDIGNITVFGDLRLSDTPITTLPENMFVRGILCLRGTRITKLPESLIAGKVLW
ncbi:hypothetical protein RU50_003367 [Salmonella enterica subsp. enterica]|nr:hypothetical protein [Salmonella enterica subsp. enterica]